MIGTLCRIISLHLGVLSLCAACSSDTSGGSDPGPKKSGLTLETVNFPNANLVYRGADSGIDISHYYDLTLYTDMVLDPVGNPIGPGQMLRLSINAEPYASGATEFPLPAGDYVPASSWSDFMPGTFNYGFLKVEDLPGGDPIEIPVGSFFGDIPAGATSFDADLLSEGRLSVVRNGDTYTLSGIVSGSHCLKRKFVYTGALPVVDRSNGSDNKPNTNLTGDVTLQASQARLNDRGDSFSLQDESMRVFELYLAAGGVDLGPLWPAGDGALLKVEFFVPWNTSAQSGIPAGTYTVVAQESSGGIMREYLKPGGICPGYPNRFTYPEGSWYEVLAGGKMTGYARIAGGTVTVVRNGDAHEIQVDLADCKAGTPNRVRCTYTRQTPIPIYQFNP